MRICTLVQWVIQCKALVHWVRRCSPVLSNWYFFKEKSSYPSCFYMRNSFNQQNGTGVRPQFASAKSLISRPFRWLQLSREHLVWFSIRAYLDSDQTSIQLAISLIWENKSQVNLLAQRNFSQVVAEGWAGLGMAAAWTLWYLFEVILVQHGKCEQTRRWSLMAVEEMKVTDFGSKPPSTAISFV